MSNNWFDNPLIPADLRARIADRYATFAGVRMEAAGDGGDGGDGGSGGGDDSEDTGDQGGQEQTFTQADLDKVIDGVVARERKKHAAEVKELRSKAEKGATAEERIADLEKQIEATTREALKRRVQAAHQISDEDADLFLTGADEETLAAQAKRLAERESERKKQGNRVAREGRTPATKANEEREAVRSLFGTGG